MASDGRATLFAYPWDVAPLPPGRMADELYEMGLNALTLAACYHAGKFVRPHAADGRVVFPLDGHVHCRIDAADGFSRIRPLPNPAAERDDVFGRLTAEKRIPVTAWIVLLHNTALVMLHPDAAARNAAGDAYTYSLCPSHPEARAYAVALCQQIAERYDLAGLTIETPGWLPYRHGFHHEFELVTLDCALQADLGLCFCDACLAGSAAAGIDVTGLRRQTLARIDAAFASPVDRPEAEAKAWMLSQLALNAELSAFYRWRCDVVSDLVAEIRAAVRPDVAVYVVPSVAQPGGMSFLEGSDLAGLARAADGVEICLYGGTPEQVLTDHAVARALVGEEGDLRVVLRPATPDWGSEAGFATAMAGLRRAGQRDVGFYNYGHLRRENLAWIARAMRVT